MGWRVIYHATFTDADPSAQTITFLSDRGRKFRVTFDPPGCQDFVASHGVKEVDSDQGLLVYTPTVHNAFVVGTGDLPSVCPEARRVGRTEVVGRAANRYACKPSEVDQFSEVTIDSDSGILLAAKSETSAIDAASIDLNVTIPAGSFDLPQVPRLLRRKGCSTASHRVSPTPRWLLPQSKSAGPGLDSPRRLHRLAQHFWPFTRLSSGWLRRRSSPTRPRRSRSGSETRGVYRRLLENADS
jgi:hypothetical protein